MSKIVKIYKKYVINVPHCHLIFTLSMIFAHSEEYV